ncbi:unnamed protein product [Moneuplotes crassus]|uniref:Uncharacterized protein n=1 Tax=Euplotes crassus TaxID=5936 RepID=A0AAD1TZI0_EUPCR|nr:unnamed protein product [Moneuplotes crassus]
MSSWCISRSSEENSSQLNLTEFEDELFSDEEQKSITDNITFHNKNNPKKPSPLFALPKINSKISSPNKKKLKPKIDQSKRRNSIKVLQLKPSKTNDPKKSLFVPTHKTYMIKKAIDDADYSFRIDPSQSYEFQNLRPRDGKYLRRSNLQSKQAVISFVSKQKVRRKGVRVRESDICILQVDNHLKVGGTPAGLLRRSSTVNAPKQDPNFCVLIERIVE